MDTVNFFFFIENIDVLVESSCTLNMFVFGFADVLWTPKKDFWQIVLYQKTKFRGLPSKTETLWKKCPWKWPVLLVKVTHWSILTPLITRTIDTGNDFSLPEMDLVKKISVERPKSTFFWPTTLSHVQTASKKIQLFLTLLLTFHHQKWTTSALHNKCQWNSVPCAQPPHITLPLTRILTEKVLCSS